MKVSQPHDDLQDLYHVRLMANIHPTCVCCVLQRRISDSINDVFLSHDTMVSVEMEKEESDTTMKWCYLNVVSLGHLLSEHKSHGRVVFDKSADWDSAQIPLFHIQRL